MVKAALKERVPDKYQQLEASQELVTFSDLLAKSILERIEALDDPAPALRRDGPLMERVRNVAEIRNEAIKSVLEDMLSTESLEAETSTFQSAA
ncbi:MAG: hypothetical protein AB7V08_13780 [Elusimicrobiales bacterium]